MIETLYGLIFLLQFKLKCRFSPLEVFSPLPWERNPHPHDFLSSFPCGPVNSVQGAVCPTNLCKIVLERLNYVAMSLKEIEWDWKYK